MATRVSNLAKLDNEKRLQVNLGRYFKNLNEDIQKALQEYWSDTGLLVGQLNLIVSPIHEKHQEYYKLVLSHKLNEYNRGVKEGKRLVERAEQRTALKSEAKRVPVNFTHNRENIFGTIDSSEQSLRDDTFTATEKTLSRVDENIRGILSDGYRSGVGIDEVARQIEERFTELASWEAKRIARTELHTAHSLGRRDSYIELGVKYTEWVSATDKRVRGNKKTDKANHVILNGEIKPINGTYSNGLRYPGDKSGKIEEWINCRCSEAPYIMEPGVAPPTGMQQFKEKDLINVAEPNYDALLLEETGGRLDYEGYRKVLMEGKALEEVMIQSAVAHQDDGIHVEGLETFETFVETIQSENKALYRACKRHDCFEEVYSILSESQVSEFSLKEVSIVDISKMKKDELKELIGRGDLDLFNETFDLSWKKFCEEWDLMYEFAAADREPIIDDEKVLQAVVHGVNEGGYSLAYLMETKSKNKKGGHSLMLAIDF